MVRVGNDQRDSIRPYCADLRARELTYQQNAISWPQRFENTEPLQQMLSRFHFSETEISAYRIRWAAWLKPKHQPATRCAEANRRGSLHIGHQSYKNTF